MSRPIALLVHSARTRPGHIVVCPRGCRYFVLTVSTLDPKRNISLCSAREALAAETYRRRVHARCERRQLRLEGGT